MRGPFSLEDLSRLGGMEPEEIERYREEGLLDPGGDGVFDEYDVLRLRYILLYRGLGHSHQEIVEGLRAGRLGDPFAADMLFGAGAERLAVEDVAAQIGLSADHIRDLRVAIGVSGAMLNEIDVEALSLIRRFTDILPWEAVLEAARVMGDTLRRLTDTEMRILHAHVHEPLVAAGASPQDVAARQQGLAEILNPLVEALLVYVHRQHLVRAAVDDLLADSESDGARELEATILFVDLASFTPLAQVHGDEVAAEILERFDGLIRTLALEHHGTLVKQIGDAFMLTFTEPADAIRFAIVLDEAVGREEHFPAIRAGAHAGPVLFRLGDYVGHTVNLASRIANLAEANEILVTEEVAAAATFDGIDVDEVGDREIRGVVGPVRLFRIARRGARATRRERDPVCGMLVTEPAGRLIVGGFEFAFCSQDCLRVFLEDPDRYATAE